MNIDPSLPPILEFAKEYRFLSNFYPSELVWEGKVWKTSEHAYQAAKTLDLPEREYIRKLASPSLAKQNGRLVDVRPHWDELKYDIMKEIVDLKFRHNPELLKKLIATDGVWLEEGNHHGDKIWGTDIKTRVGNNWLGMVLMELREVYIEEFGKD
jgi:ribA/ribD-fused uncharacterized protein